MDKGTGKNALRLNYHVFIFNFKKNIEAEQFKLASCVTAIRPSINMWTCTLFMYYGTKFITLEKKKVFHSFQFYIVPSTIEQDPFLSTAHWVVQHSKTLH